jgi:hypothetical protein
VNDDIGSEVLDRGGERPLVEEVAQDWNDASGAESLDFLWRPGHRRDDMAFG